MTNASTASFNHPLAIPLCSLAAFLFGPASSNATTLIYTCHPNFDEPPNIETLWFAPSREPKWAYDPEIRRTVSNSLHTNRECDVSLVSINGYISTDSISPTAEISIFQNMVEVAREFSRQGFTHEFIKMTYMGKDQLDRPKDKGELNRVEIVVSIKYRPRND